MAQYNRIVGENSHPNQVDGEWEVVVVGQRGTEIKEAPDSIVEGLTLAKTLREADADGYTTNIVGYAYIEGKMSGYDFTGKHMLSRNLYFRKSGRYGKIGGLKFNFTSRENYRRDLGRSVAYDFIWWFDIESLWMQSEILGHRVLEPKENLQK